MFLLLFLFVAACMVLGFLVNYYLFDYLSSTLFCQSGDGSSAGKTTQNVWNNLNTLPPSPVCEHPSTSNPGVDASRSPGLDSYFDDDDDDDDHDDDDDDVE